MTIVVITNKMIQYYDVISLNSITEIWNVRLTTRPGNGKLPAMRNAYVLRSVHGQVVLVVHTHWPNLSLNRERTK